MKSFSHFVTLVACAFSITQSAYAESLKEQAIKVCTDEFNRRTLHDGQDWYFEFTNYGDHFFRQARGITITVLEKPITEADRLNGIDWAGGVTIATNLMRLHTKGKWDSWSQVEGYPLLDCPIKHVNGSWTTNFQPPGAGVPPSLGKIPP